MNVEDYDFQWPHLRHLVTQFCRRAPMASTAFFLRSSRGPLMIAKGTLVFSTSFLKICQKCSRLSGCSRCGSFSQGTSIYVSKYKSYFRSLITLRISGSTSPYLNSLHTLMTRAFVSQIKTRCAS